MAERTNSFDPAAAVAAAGLLALAGLTAWNASRLDVTTTYGMGPEAVPYAVALGLAVLGLAHLVVARTAAPQRESLDRPAILWIAAGLATLAAAIAFGAGFVPGAALLFAATARAFGRTAFVADLLIGLALALSAYLLFTKLLGLTLPGGPLERLL
jgi:putative tricarboxylic transport membrane protein